MGKILIPLNPRTRNAAHEAIKAAPDGHSVLISEPTRTEKQNALLWPMLACFANQLVWPVNGRLVEMNEEDWKDLLTAAFRQEEQRVSPSLTGHGMVLLGEHTSGYGVKEFSEFIEYVKYQAAERGVDLMLEREQ